MGAKGGAIAAGVALVMAMVPGLAREATTAPVVVDRAVATPSPMASQGGEVVVGDVAITAPDEFVGAVPEPPTATPPPTLDATPAAQRGGTYAVVVGVNDYPGRRYDLQAASPDALLVDQALEGFGVPVGNRVLLRDGQATAATVRAALRQLAASGDEHSTLVFAFAGHARKLDHDTEELVFADGETITDAELADLLRATRAKHVWLLLDSCYSGDFTEALAPGRVLTGSAAAGRISYENRRLKASYLSHFLVRKGWLEGKATGASVQAAFDYADAAIARRYPNRRPVEIDMAGEPLVLGPGSPKTSTPVVPAPPPEPHRSSPPPPTTTTTEPPPPAEPPTEIRDCDLVVFCKE
jgi:hypothetical protein